MVVLRRSSRGWFRERISGGNRTLDLERNLTHSQSPTVMLRPVWTEISCFMKRSHNQSLTVGICYLRVTKTSLWWQQREFPGVWTTEGLSFCMEKGYIWSINSSTWNHLQALWQGTPLDLLRSILKETQHQDRIEAGGYRSLTWRILRALKAVNEAKMVVGESAVTVAPFFASAGRPSQPFWGPQQGNKLVLWESLDEEEQARCWSARTGKRMDCVVRANPGKMDKGRQAFKQCGRCIFTGKCKQVTTGNTNREEASGGKHVTRARV